MVGYREFPSIKWLITVFLLQACSPESLESSQSNPEKQWLNDVAAVTDTANSIYPLNPLEFSTQLAARTSRISVRGIFTVANSSPIGSAAQDQSPPFVKGGLIASLDRVSIRQGADIVEQLSQWDYAHVLRSSVSVDAVANNAPLSDQLVSIEPTSSLQRAALNLAGASNSELWVANNKVSIDPMVFSPPDSCSAGYQWQSELSVTLRVRLEFVIESCPQVQRVGGYSRWQVGGLVANGFIDELDNLEVISSTPIDAKIWFSHGWGEVPSVGEAVVIDTLTIDIGQQRGLDISRSRRRSGRGPVTVSASLIEQDGMSRTIELLWKDGDELVAATSGAQYPKQITLSSAEEDIELRVQIMNRAIETDSGFGNSLNVPVIVSGSHTGSGFLNYVSINTQSP